MATASKNIYCSNYPSSYPYVISVTFTESSVSTANNTSKISISGYLVGNNINWSSNYYSYLKLYWHDNKTNKDTLVKTSTGFKSTTKGQKVTVSGSITVSHKDDGTLSGYAKLSFIAGSTAGGYSPSSSSVQTANTALTKIARASSISSLTGTYLGSPVTVKITRASSSFTHKVEYSFAGSGYVTATSSATTSATFTPPLSLATNIPNSVSGTLTVRVTTYNGSSQIGSAVTKNITLKLESDILPIIGDIILTRIDNEVPESWELYVKGFSQCNINIDSAEGIYGSTIKAYSISGSGINSNEKTATTDILNTPGTVVFTCSVTDSRGRIASKQISIEVVDYSYPSIKVNAKRCTSDGTINSAGTYLKVTVDYSISDIKSNNYVSFKQVECNDVINTEFLDEESFILNANCSQKESYTLTALIRDALNNEISASVKISTDERIININANKKGAAIGKFSEGNGFEVGWNSQFYEDARFYKKLILESGYEPFTMKSILNSEMNLNNIKEPGFYNQYNDIEASISLNYPIEKSGILIVGYTDNENYVIQYYHTFENSELYFRTYFNNSWNPWEKMMKEEDSGWKNCAYQTGFNTYSSSYSNLQVRKINNVVHLRGTVKRIGNITPSDDTSVLMAIMPSGYAPAYREYFICQGSGSNRFLLSIYDNGNIYISRYSDSATTNEEIPDGAWLNCYATWFLG